MRKTPVKRVNRARRKKEWPRAYGSKERVAFVKSLPCLVGSTCPWAECFGSIDNAHIRNGGMGRKADATVIIPLCLDHHAYLHQQGQRSFCDRYGVDLSRAAAETERLWQQHLALKGEHLARSE